MRVPDHLRGYPCDDYFASRWAARGFWDEPSQLMLIVPAANIEERPHLSMLLVGRPGVDGIEFGYRSGHPGLWAYYPIDREFVAIVLTVDELIEKFVSGKLLV